MPRKLSELVALMAVSRREIVPQCIIHELLMSVIYVYRSKILNARTYLYIDAVIVYVYLWVGKEIC